jgi:hypothetical protein
MAQALSIVGEAGIHGMKYNAIIETYENQSAHRQSKRLRISAVSAHRFSAQEFENYMILAWRWGLVKRSSFEEYEFQQGVNKSSYQLDDEIVSLTPSGWEFSNSYDTPLLHRWWNNVSSNVPTIIISVIVAVVSAFFLKLTGLSK